MPGALAPELLVAEVANALAGYVRAEEIAPRIAAISLGEVLALPLRLVRLNSIVVAAFETALRHGVSVYDGCYLALAEQTNAVLVTADGRLAALAPHAELVD